MNISRYSKAAVDAAATISSKLRKKAPELLAVAGVFSFAGTIYTACKATTKLDAIKQEACDKLDEIDETEKLEREDYTPEDAQKDRGIVKVQTAVKIAKLYAPSAALCVGTLMCFFGSHYILRKRNLALSAAAVASDKALKEYRKKVAEKFGEEVENDLRYGLINKEVEVEETDEKGKTKKKKTTEKVADRQNGYKGPFDFYFDSTVPGHEHDGDLRKDSYYNRMYILQIQDWANKELKRKYMYFHQGLTVAEICDRFNVARMPGALTAGYIYDPKDPACKEGRHIDFGIYNVHDEDAKEFVNGYNRDVKICLNPDTLDLESLEP